MFVTEDEYERWPSDMWERLASEGRTWGTCAMALWIDDAAGGAQFGTERLHVDRTERTSRRKL